MPNSGEPGTGKEDKTAIESGLTELPVRPGFLLALPELQLPNLENCGEAEARNFPIGRLRAKNCFASRERSSSGHRGDGDTVDSGLVDSGLIVSW